FSRDWSSDVCSSDLEHLFVGLHLVGVISIHRTAAMASREVALTESQEAESPARGAAKTCKEREQLRCDKLHAHSLQHVSEARFHSHEHVNKRILKSPAQAATE